MGKTQARNINVQEDQQINWKSVRKAAFIILAIIIFLVTIYFASAGKIEVTANQTFEPDVYTTDKLICKNYSICQRYNTFSSYFNDLTDMRIESKETIDYGLVAVNVSGIYIPISKIAFIINSTKLQVSFQNYFKLNNYIGLGLLKEEIKINSLPSLIKNKDIILWYNLSTNATIISTGTEIFFISGENAFGKFRQPYLNDSVGNLLRLNYSLSGNLISITFPSSYLQSAVFPIVFDPTYDDFSAGISSTQWTTRNVNSACTTNSVSATTYEGQDVLQLQSNSPENADSTCVVEVQSNNSYINLSNYDRVIINTSNMNMNHECASVASYWNISFYGLTVNASRNDNGIVSNNISFELFRQGSQWNFTALNRTGGRTEYGLFTINVASNLSFLTTFGGNSALCTGGQGNGGVIMSVNSVEYFEISPPTFSGLQNNASSSRYGDTVKWNVTLSDSVALNTSTFSWNGTGTGFVNDSVVSLSGQSSVQEANKTTNLTYNNYICGRFYVNDSSGNSNFTVDSCYTVANTVPAMNPFTLSPTNPATDINCSFTFTDIENAMQSYANETRWYVNGSLISEATNRTLLAGNATLNANISCEAKVYDGVNYSSPLNSSILVVGDTVVPSFQSGSATNVTTAESSNITAIIQDASSSINSVTAEILDPANVKTNFSLSFLSGTNAAGQNSTWQRSYNDVAGTYWIKFYFQDSSGNADNTSENYTSFIISTVSTSSGGAAAGGGGSSPPSITCTDQNNQTLWQVTTELREKSYNILLPLSSSRPRTKSLLFSNLGTEPVTLFVSCEPREDKDICEQVEFSDSSITVEPSQIDVARSSLNVYPIPDSAYIEEYFFNVKVTDNSRCEGRLTIQATVHPLGEFYKFTTIPLSRFSGKEDTEASSALLTFAISFFTAFFTYVIIQNYASNISAILLALLSFLSTFILFLYFVF